MTAIANLPVVGPASAATLARIGLGPTTLLDITARETVSDATLVAGASPILSFGTMSAGYGGSGESLTCESRDFNALNTPQVDITFLNYNIVKGGFDALELKINVGGDMYDFMFYTLSVAEQFFANNTVSLARGGEQFVDVSYWLTGSDPGSGFGFTYNLAVPEMSSWAMLLLGFAGLGFAGWRVERKTATHAA